MIDEIKTVFRGFRDLREPEQVHLAQARCYAFIYAEKEGLDRIGIRMTYCSQVTGEVKRFYEVREFGELKAWFESEHDVDACRLQRENMQRARDLGECMAERDGYRDKLGRAVDSAWEIVQLMDEGAA